MAQNIRVSVQCLLYEFKEESTSKRNPADPRPGASFQLPTYPTGSFNFLRNIPKPETNGIASGHSSNCRKLQLDIIVICAGVGGLSTAIALKRKGHHVRIYEAAKELSEVYPTLLSSSFALPTTALALPQSDHKPNGKHRLEREFKFLRIQIVF